MARPSVTNSLTVVATLTGLASAAGAAFGNDLVHQVALGLAVAAGAVLVRSVARDLGRASQQSKQLEAQLSGVAEDVRVLRSGNRRIHTDLNDHAERTAEQIAAMTRRILVDVHAARLEELDARDRTGRS